jgi:hypothetical protein
MSLRPQNFDLRNRLLSTTFTSWNSDTVMEIWPPFSGSKSLPMPPTSTSTSNRKPIRIYCSYCDNLHFVMRRSECTVHTARGQPSLRNADCSQKLQTYLMRSIRQCTALNYCQLLYHQTSCILRLALLRKHSSGNAGVGR